MILILIYDIPFLLVQGGDAHLNCALLKQHELVVDMTLPSHVFPNSGLIFSLGQAQQNVPMKKAYG